MTFRKRRDALRSILSGSGCIRPGSVYDAISIRIAQDLGFEVGMFGGSIASLAVLGDPDIALITLTELAEQMRRMSRAAALPVLVDADHGYGNALNVRRTVEELETAGAAGLTIEELLGEPDLARVHIPGHGHHNAREPSGSQPEQGGDRRVTGTGCCGCEHVVSLIEGVTVWSGTCGRHKPERVSRATRIFKHTIEQAGTRRNASIALTTSGPRIIRQHRRGTRVPNACHASWRSDRSPGKTAIGYRGPLTFVRFLAWLQGPDRGWPRCAGCR